MEPAGKAGRKRAAGMVTLLFVFAVCLFLAWGNARQEALPGVAVASDFGEEYVPLLCVEQEGSVWLACGGADTSLLLRLDAETGAVLAGGKVDIPLYWAGIREGKLLAWEDASGNAVLVSYDAETLKEISRRELGWPSMSIVHFNCDPSGTAYAVLSQSRDCLRISPADGEERSWQLPGDAEFLDRGEDGGFWVYDGEKLYTARLEEEFREISCFAPPLALLGNGKLIDRDGTVCGIEEAGLRPLFQCSELLYGRFSFCLDGENCLIVSNSDRINRYGPEGRIVESCSLEKTAFLVCRSGAFYLAEGVLYYSPFAFSRITPEPSAEPSPAPGEPPVRVENGYLLMSVGSTADELRELFKPEAVDIRGLTGKQVVHGKLATGMTAGEWILVIEGDTDGSGTVTGADLRAALKMSMEPPAEGSPWFRAADLNGDGVVDTADLVLLSAMAAGEGR